MCSSDLIFNRDNLETFTAGAHCTPCGLRGRCSLEGSYEELSDRWFAAGPPTQREPLRIPPAAAESTPPSVTMRRPLVWLTLDSVAATSPAAVAHPSAPRLFVIDTDWLAAERPSLNRLVFLFECLGDIPGIEVVAGDLRESVAARALAHGCDGVVLAETPCPRIRRAVAAVATGLSVAMLPWPRFCRRDGVRDLGRFSRYWQKVGPSAMKPTAES